MTKPEKVPCTDPKEIHAQNLNLGLTKHTARGARKRRRYGSCEGEIAEAPPNLLRDEKGRHRFGAGRPNGLWIADVTELRIPAGKACP